jgi:hypothetical protein
MPKRGVNFCLISVKCTKSDLYVIKARPVCITGKITSLVLIF